MLYIYGNQNNTALLKPRTVSLWPHKDGFKTLPASDEAPPVYYFRQFLSKLELNASRNEWNALQL